MKTVIYKSADLEMNITVCFDPVDGFLHSKGHFEAVYQGHSIMWLNQQWLYKSADTEMNININFDPVDGFWQSNGHF